VEKNEFGAYRKALLARRGELDALEATGEEAARTVELDQTSVGRVSRIDALQNQALALANKRNREAERSRIAAALRRIEDGTYGDCLSCDEPIEVRRLQFDPAIATCITCARGG
jgi:DnaK suppressor protein